MQNYLLVFLALSHNVFATPIEISSTEISTTDTAIISGEEGLLDENVVETISALEFSGPVTPGGPDVQLSGTAKSIYEQIIALNSTYDVFDFPDSAASLQAGGITRETIDQVPGSDVSTTAAVRTRDLLKRQDGVSTPKAWA
ncbi:hypothetical protein VTL71DRAFT_13228 [Oculimacula yallundae]|uniref:Uncharacterized protein n=1 Tax=Oculimacula yallundae TaxID=86028 RepID=A0ABR4CL15_9HELO